MKKIFTLVFVLTAFIGAAQRTMFGSQNSYVAPIGPSLPVIGTTTVTAITGTTATSGGTITSDGGEPVTSRGLVWGTSPGSSTSSATAGTGIGAFFTNLTSLNTATTYYVRAFAANSVGTAYGNELSFTTSGPIVSSGLQLHYDAGNVSSYPTTGDTWSDISGNTGRNATLVNNPTFDPGNGGSIYTDGVNQFAQTSYSGIATDSYTFSAWFKNDNYSEPKHILGRGRDGAGNGWSLQLQVSTAGKAVAAVVPTVPSQAGIFVVGTSTLALNTWYYITAVWTAGQSIKVYVNGSLEGTTNTASTSLRTSTNGWYIGSISTTLFTSGYNAVAQVYNSALTSSEILQNFNADKTRFGY
jgi:hypothetical protein